MLLTILIFLIRLIRSIILFLLSNSNIIDALLDERAELICLEKYDELDEIDQRLEALGVTKLSSKELQKQFINTPNIVSQKPFLNIKPNVSTPSAKNVVWMSSRQNYTYAGKTYEIQTLIAQPNEYNSNLKKIGHKAISSTYKWAAGAKEVLSISGESLVGLIPYSNIPLTFYDCVSGFIQGISRTTEISDVEIMYSYAHTTTASFKYVKLKGQSDNNQRLTYISTKGTTVVGYQIPKFVASGITVQPNVIQGNRTRNLVPNGYNSNLNAVKAYTDIFAPTRAYVDKVKITGMESKVTSEIYPICPQFPPHIY